MGFRGNWVQLMVIGAMVVCMWTAYSLYGTPSLDKEKNLITEARHQKPMVSKPVTATASVDPYLKELQLQRTLNDLYRDPSTLPRDLHPSVKVVKLQPTTELPNKNCVPLPKSPRPDVKMCIYPKKQDIYVSGELEDGRLFEPDLVLQMASALKADPSLQLVDLGANIGMYTVYGAALGAHVLAVEMLPANAMMIQASLATSHIQENVTLVNNALYSDHRDLVANFISSNVGATHLNVSKTNFKKYDMVEVQGEVKVSTVCLDDLLPLLKSRRLWIKMDIERTEAKALQCAKKFFANTEVTVVMMEWLARDMANVKLINAFMEEHGFKPSTRGDRIVPVNTNVPTVQGNNVFFVRSGKS